ncbi:hypothetical protein [Micromonospora humida]|uniref:hypothetical protein n=1 Tax=Micromonospora humida TaxID=2809018 RepID=UPI0034396C79
MTTYESGETVMDILAAGTLLAGAAVALVGCATWVVVRSRRTSTVQLLGRTLHYPRVWAAGAACMGFYLPLGLGNLTEVTPSAWRAPGSPIGAGLLLAAWVLMATYWLLEYRATRRIGRDQ